MITIEHYIQKTLVTSDVCYTPLSDPLFVVVRLVYVLTIQNGTIASLTQCDLLNWGTYHAK